MRYTLAETMTSAWYGKAVRAARSSMGGPFQTVESQAEQVRRGDYAMNWANWWGVQR